MTSSGRPSPPVPVLPSPGPSMWRDPWCWASAAAVIPLVAHSLGAQLGEPVAEDFDFLRHNLLLARHSLLDGGGSEAFWRPVAHQLYYWALGPLILAQPRAVAAIHVLLLAVSAVFLYRTLRMWWSGPAAAMAASFPLLAESTRTLVSWPTHFVDLGSYLFAILAVHEAARRRLVTTLAALLAALLCKEVAVAAAALVPFVPARAPVSRTERLKWLIACAALVAVWAACYVLVRKTAGLALPHHLEAAAAVRSASPWARLAWSARNSLRAIVSLPAAPDRFEGWIIAACLLAPLVAIGALGFSAARRRRAASSLPWLAWGLAWFALSTAALATIYPIWAPNRSLFGAVGLGIAVVALLDAAHPALPAGLLLARLGAFALSPGPPETVTLITPDRGAFMDFERLSRLQLLMAEIRQTLKSHFPSLPPGTRVGFNYLPLNTEYAFGGDHALQVWYRDTTLRWVGREAYSADSTMPLAALVQYQSDHRPQIAIVRSEAMRMLMRAYSQLRAGASEPGLASLARAESLQTDTTAAVFRATVHALRATYWFFQNQMPLASAEARAAVALNAEMAEPHFVLAAVAYRAGDRAEMESEYRTLEVVAPGDPRLDKIRRQLAQMH